MTKGRHLLRLFLALLFAGSIVAANAQQAGPVSRMPFASTPFNGSELLYVIQNGVSTKTNFATFQTQVFPGFGPGVIPALVNGVCMNGGIMVEAQTSAGLSAISTLNAGCVRETGYYAVGDMHPLIYYPGTVACPAADGISQKASANGKCWIAQFGGRAWADQAGVASGVSDNESTLNAWLALASPSLELDINVGTYQFGCNAACVSNGYALSLPQDGSQGITLHGGGKIATQLVYVGTSHTVNLLQGGTTSANSTGWNLSGFSIYPKVGNGNQTAGADLLLIRLSHSTLTDVAGEVSDFGSRLSWNNFVFEGAHQVINYGLDGYGRNDGAEVFSYNQDGTNDSDIYFVNSVFDFNGIPGSTTAGCGIRVGGGFGGVFTLNTETLGNTLSNVCVDHALTASLPGGPWGNREILLGSNTVQDGVQSQSQHGLYVDDTLAVGGNLVEDSFLGSSIQNGITIKNWPGVVSVGAPRVFNNCANGIEVDDPLTFMQISDRTVISSNGGYNSQPTSTTSCTAAHPVTASADGGGKILFTGPNNYTVGQTIAFQTYTVGSTGGTAPTNITLGLGYCVIANSLTTTTFEVATSCGGTAPAFVSAGSQVGVEAGYGVYASAAPSGGGAIYFAGSAFSNVSGDYSPLTLVGWQSYTVSGVCGASGATFGTITAWAKVQDQHLVHLIVSIPITLIGSGASGCSVGAGSGVAISLPTSLPLIATNGTMVGYNDTANLGSFAQTFAGTRNILIKSSTGGQPGVDASVLIVQGDLKT